MIYIQSFCLILLETFCCKMFIEAFGKSRSSAVLRNYAVLAGWLSGLYLASMVLENTFFMVKQGILILVTVGFMTLYFKMGILKAIILASLFQGLLSAIDYGVLFCIVSVFHTMPQPGEAHYIGSVLFIIIGRIALFMAVLAVRRGVGKKQDADLTNAQWLRFLFFPVLSIGMIAALITTSGSVAGKDKEDVFIAIAFCLAGMNIVVFSLVNDILKREKELRRNKALQAQAKNQTILYRSISENFENQKKKTHEFKNQMLCMEALAAQKKYDDLEKYIRSICKGLADGLPVIQTNHVIVDAVLNSKYQEMREKNIVFIFEMNDLSEIRMKEEDLVVVLSNLLNNAIEACEQHRNERWIKLKFVKEEKAVILSVKNTFSHEIKCINGEIRTTKEYEKEEHGVGMKNIRDTVAGYGGICTVQYHGGEFFFSIMIPQ